MKTIVCFTIFLLSSYHLFAQNLNMWYDRPALRWEETLPLGNGQIGMMPDGKVRDESIVLNEISMWSGSPEDPNNDLAYKSVDRIQGLLFAGKNDEAEQLVNQHFVTKGKGSGHGNGSNVPYGCFQNFGYLNFLHTISGEVRNYKRTLNLSTATATTSFEADGIFYLREYFTSLDQNVGVIRLSASKKGAISFATHFYRDEGVRNMNVTDTDMLWSGALSDGKGGDGLQFAGKIQVIAQGGSSMNYDHQIIVKQANEVLLFFAASTDYYEHDPQKAVQDLLADIPKSTYNDLWKAHCLSFREVFDRVSLRLYGERSVKVIPTDERIKRFFEDPTKDSDMATLYYQFGRYLSIASTAPKEGKALPPNLQGLWAYQIQTPWNGDYHLNVNAQMNHWGVEVNNLSEYHKPFINLVKRIAKEGEKTAKAYYNAPGWVVYMMTNVWGYTAPGEEASWGASTASGWLCNHLWEHYQFTEDQEYLAEIYPVLKGAAVFYHATLVKDPKTGWWITAPSVSPENAFKMPNGQVASVAMGPTIDNQIVRELYEAVIQANAILHLDDPFVNKLEQQLVDLPPPVIISPSGRVMEWLEDYEEVEPEHRHVSHLYGLYPGHFISPVSTPEWAAAAKKTLQVRGDEGTGWSRAWKLLFWARLHDGDHALEILRQLLKPALKGEVGYEGLEAGTYPNLFCAHPPFQIDGNFGGSAGIAEMLLQSHDGYIHLLPALPSAWHRGQVKGLKARGNVTVDIRWKDGKVTSYMVRGKNGDTVRLLVNGKMIKKKI